MTLSSLGGEDVDLGIRLTSGGLPLRAEPDAVAVRYTSAGPTCCSPVFDRPRREPTMRGATLRPASAVVAVDRAVLDHAEPLLHRLGTSVPVHPFVIDPDETRKRLSQVESLLDHAVGSGSDRVSVVVAMGGGLVGNLAGLELPAARTALRDFDREDLAARLSRDNKRGHVPLGAGSIPMVLLRSLGEPLNGPGGLPVVPVPVEVVLDSFEKVAANEAI